MMMSLNVQKRDVFRKKLSELRQKGLIPAELYSHNIDNVHLSIIAGDFESLLKKAGETSVFNLHWDKEERPVLIQNIHYHPVTDKILAVDFYQVKLDEAVETEVPLEFIGESAAVNDKNGVLVKVRHDILVEALPNNIPQRVEVDLEKLKEIGDVIHISDLMVPKDVKILTESGEVVATVKEQEAEVVEAVTTEEAIAGVKVEGKEKKKEGEDDIESEKKS